MNRRNFLTGLTLLPTMSLFSRVAHANENDLTIGIFPGAGSAEMPLDQLRASLVPFARELGDALGVEAKLTIFRTIKSVTRSLEKGRLDLYFVGPTVAVSVLDNGYVPVARVKDPISGSIVRRKGVTVKTVALTEKESWPDVMSRYALKRNNQSVEILNLKTIEDVILAMDRDHAQAGGLGAKFANELIAKGTHEVWYPLAPTPGFTLMSSDRLTENEQSRIGAAAVGLKPELIKTMQKVIGGKVAGFVIDKQADYKTLKLAMQEAGY